MRMPKRGEKGFTLIELLIVVAILGVLAAVIIPNVSRFFGSGEEEARRTEKSNIQLAVDSMMIDNSIALLPNAVDTTPTATMSAFPDATSACETADKLLDPEGNAYVVATDGAGYLLYNHDITGGTAGDNIDYLRDATTEYFYTVDADGTVHQWADAIKTGGEYLD